MRCRGIAVIGVLVLLFLGQAAWAQGASVPQQINYQGRLVDALDVPVSQNDLPMTFSIYDGNGSITQIYDEPIYLYGEFSSYLFNQNLVPDSEVVTMQFGATLFTYHQPTDYLMNYPAGTIQRVGSGGIPDGAMVSVDYQYSTPPNMIWFESQLVDVVDGIFEVKLGAVNVLDSNFFNVPGGYLEVVVDGETLAPRQPFTSVAYAMRASNAMMLEGYHSSDFAFTNHTHPSAPHNHNAADINAGTLGTGFYSSVSDLISEGYLDNDADADLLSRIQADGRYTNEGQVDSITGTMVNFNYAGSLTEAGPAADLVCIMCVTAGEMADGAALAEIVDDDGTGSGLDADLLDGQHGASYRSASNINAGALANDYFSAYSDLSTENYLDNDSNTDLLTRLQSDGRFINTTGDDSMTGSLTVGGDLTVSGGNIGVGRAADTGNNYGILYSSTTAPSTGAKIYGLIYGLEVENTGTENNFAYIAAGNYGIFTGAGNSSTPTSRTGGYFWAESLQTSRGIQTESWGYGDWDSTGVGSIAYNYGEGDAYGLRVYGAVYGATADVYGVYAEGESAGGGNSYGGYFLSTDVGIGPNYGVYAMGDDEAGRFENGLVPENNYVVLADGIYGVRAVAGDELDPAYAYGGEFKAYSQDIAVGVDVESNGYTFNGDATAVRAYAHGNNGSGEIRGGFFYGGGSYYQNYGVYSYGLGLGGAETYGVYTYAAGTGTNYGLYVAMGSKNWVNPDPEDPGKSIVYATLEGGENGTYWRGTARLDNGRAEVILPDHFRKVTSPDYPVTVTVTPRGQCNGLMLAETTNARIVVEELMNGTSDADFDFIIMGKRLGYEDFNPEIENKDYVPFSGNHASMDPALQTTQEFYDHQPDGLKKIFKQNGTLDQTGKVNEKLFKEKNWKVVKEKTSN